MTESQTVSEGQDKQESHISPHLTITPQEYMKERVVWKINIYDKLAKQHRRRYQAISLVGIILAASVPVLINTGVDPRVPTVISLIVTILISIERLFHYREHWRNYDEMAAFLRTEQLRFQTRVGDYEEKPQHNGDGCNDDKAFQNFVKRIEHAISNERKDTIEMRTSEDNSE